jgi:hypothetical protein
LVLQADTKVSEEHTASTFTNTNVVWLATQLKQLFTSVMN